MLVPRFWAESRAQQLAPDGKPIIARRFGWSDLSQPAAQTMADQRARETLALLVAGQPIPRRDPALPYNGADGVPIREEIVSRHGETVLTRNAYGALCLNTPNAFFTDVDFRAVPAPARSKAGGALPLLAALAVASIAYRTPAAAVAAFLVLYLCGTVLARRWTARGPRLPGDPEAIALQAVRRFAAEHPDWSLRLYRTPVGLRVLATHRTFLPDDPAVPAGFDALSADPVYVRMCLRQRCFRDRVSPKPWRIGVREHIRPRRAAWPVAPEASPARAEWVARYDEAARSFASCRFLEALGPGLVHPDVQPVLELHDALCRTSSGFPIA